MSVFPISLVFVIKMLDRCGLLEGMPGPENAATNNEPLVAVVFLDLRWYPFHCSVICAKSV